MRFASFALVAGALAPMVFGADGVRAYEGTVAVPTYEHSGRETEPPLFANSTVTGMYPFTTYLMPFRTDTPQPHSYRAVFLENEYLKITHIPDFGGRFFSVYDKIRGREMLYRNDVIKPAAYNPRSSWPQSGMELTGPHDLHMLTLHGEPFWANQVMKRDDGSVSLVLGAVDPVYGMKVNFSATLHPGVAAVEIGVSCYNGQDARMPQMLWVNTAIAATPKTRFIYPMSRTVGHTTADIADWPLYNGIDFSWDRNNTHMLGVFGIDIYDDFQGAYQFDREYGIFRYGDRRVVQGMKLWTFGYGPAAKSHERGYTDNAGPYVELQSGRHVWDGHYEWVAPHKTEGWTEWWIPVANTDGLTTLTRDVALNVEPASGGADVVLAATHAMPSAELVVTSGATELLRRRADLRPESVLRVHVGAAGPLRVAVRDGSGRVVLDYAKPEASPGRKEYTPFTKPLESPRKAPDSMSVEELAIAAEFKLKELDSAGAQALLGKALERDPGYSRALLLLGIDEFRAGRAEDAISHLQRAIERDPYSDESYYYLAMAEFAAGRDGEAERNLYFIWPDSAHFGEREFHLGRLDMVRNVPERAVGHFERSVAVNAGDLAARHALAIAYRELGKTAAANQQLEAMERADPTSAAARAERWLAANDAASREDLLRITGAQTQEAIALTIRYRNLGRWADAARVLRVIGENNRDPWGTTPEFWYTLAYCQKRAGDAESADRSRAKAKSASANIDRFPYRPEAEPVLREAVAMDPADAVARYALGCLLYYRQRAQEAIEQWQAALQTAPKSFSLHRALGLAYAEQGNGVEQAAAELERAVQLNPRHTRTLNDLSGMYARSGQFDKQLALLEKALASSPGDDDLTEAVFTAKLLTGDYSSADEMIRSHRFAPRHRSYGLRDRFRAMRYAQAAQAYRDRKYEEALKLLQSAAQPPESLGIDDFAGQGSPRQRYYLGVVLQALGRGDDARKSFEAAAAGADQLSGDRDSWSADNFFIVLALDKLGQKSRASALNGKFEAFARSEADSRNADYRARANYLLALIRMREGRGEQAGTLLDAAAKAAPDFLPAQLSRRKDEIGL